MQGNLKIALKSKKSLKHPKTLESTRSLKMRLLNDDEWEMNSTNGRISQPKPRKATIQNIHIG
jgi:hypothetical protein